MKDGVFLSDFGYRVKIATTPASGGGNADFVLLPNNGLRLRIFCVTFDLTTDATVANRIVQLLFRWQGDTPAVPHIVATAAVAQPAGQTWQYIFVPGSESSLVAVNNRVMVRLPYPPEIFGGGTVNEGWRIESDVQNLQAGDDLLGSSGGLAIYGEAVLGGSL